MKARIFANSITKQIKSFDSSCAGAKPMVSGNPVKTVDALWVVPLDTKPIHVRSG